LGREQGGESRVTAVSGVGKTGLPSKFLVKRLRLKNGAGLEGRWQQLNLGRRPNFLVRQMGGTGKGMDRWRQEGKAKNGL